MNRISMVFAIAVSVLALGRAPVLEAAQEAKTSAPAQTDDAVVAKVLGQSITEKQVLGAIDQIARSRQMPPQMLQQRNTLLFKEALDSLVSFVLLRNEASEKHITVDKQKIDESFQTLVKRFPSEEEFKKAAEKQGITEESLRVSIEENLLYEKVLDQVVKDVPAPTDEAIQKFYDDNPQYFEQPEQVHAAHILLQVDPKATPEQKAEIKARLEAIRADIESRKITFAEAAAKDSEDKSNAADGGDLGFFPRGRMVKPFDDAAFSTAPGTISPVVETQFGYHLINVLEKKPAGKKSLEESKQNIAQFLEGQSKQDAVQKHLSDLKAKATVENVMSEEEWARRHAAK